jgi:DNA-binding HxlR family transcriptional regulator
LATIGDRWGFFVLWLAFAGVTRFDHFHGILGVARTTLADRLVEWGLIKRTRYRERPARYDYRLTPRGQALCPVLLTVSDWGNRQPEPAKAPAAALHKSCGESLSTVVIGDHCREPVTAHDVLRVDRRHDKTSASNGSRAAAGVVRPSSKRSARHGRS